ncbi:MAG: B12-binding domain-containing radical SAM protein, partial [Deltaproteobacteria bacterium HGW-Deltaproteobacteria-20]
MSRLIVLVDLPCQRPKDPKMSVGHASLVAALQARTNVDVKSVVIPANTPKQDANALAARILEHAAGASRVDIGIGVYVWNDHLVRRLLAALRTKGLTGRIILGGPQISYSGRGLEALYPEADVFVRGYGEDALCELVQHPGRVVEGVHLAGAPD